MEIEKDEIRNLIKEKFKGNLTRFANEIGVSRSYLSRNLSKKWTGKSPKICYAIMIYSTKNKIDYNKYLFFFNTSVNK